MLRKFGQYLGASRTGSLLFGSLVIGSILTSPARAVTFGFDSFPMASNDFSITSEGLTATFSSSSGPATLTVNPTADTFTFPVALGGFGNFNGDPLTITFSDPVMDRIVIPFGIFEPYAVEPVTLVASTNTGETIEFTTAFFNLISGAPEGTVSFVPAGRITSLTLSSSMAFAIASVDVPEPTSIALLGGGLVLLALMRRQKG